MKIIKETDFNKIEDFLHSNFSSPTHWPDWNIVVSKFFNTEFFYFCAYENNELIGIFPIHKEKYGFLNNYRSGQFNYIPFGGWLFSKDVDFFFNGLPIGNLSQLQTFYLPSLPEFKTGLNGNKIHQYKTLIIDLKNDLDSIWKEQIDSKRRNMIRKAEKNDVVINVKDLDFHSFYDTYRKSSIRSDLSILSEEFFKELFDNAKNINFEIISAKREKEYLANVVIAYDKNYSIYWLGNNAVDIPNLGQGESLQWEAIKRMKEYGCRYYDLCYIEKERLPHIYKFKHGFSKNEIDVPLITLKSLSFKIFNRVSRWF